MPNQRPTNDVRGDEHNGAMRRLKPDPVLDELIKKILQAGQWARATPILRFGALWWSRTRREKEGACLLQAALRRADRAKLRRQRATAGLEP